MVSEEVLAILTQAMIDGRVTAKFTIQCGLDTTNSLGRAICSTLALHLHGCLRSTVFFRDVQVALMDIPLDGSRLFSDKADPALERFKESRVTAWALGFSTDPLHPHSSFCSFHG